ncbi:MAG: hypothetical protein LBH20_01390 [Treponema sp.]|jgi:hypothetical protein|nr:hypothetical protein [Treponema sp.]
MRNKILQVIAWIASLMAIVELALSQLTIKMTRLSAVETTGIFLFAFIIFSLVTLFAVTRMKDNPWAKIFAILMNLMTAFAATWYLRLLFSDEIFFRNLYYALNRQTQAYELLPLGGRIFASIPLAIIMLGVAVYYLCGLAILITGVAADRKKSN